jgi:SNF2 family DNA or RNA helicase
MNANDKVQEGVILFEKYLNRTGMSHKQYQYDGVRWCLNNELRNDPPHNIRGGFIADEMGLGKTIMMIGLCLGNYMKKTLIIVPPILINQWYDQIYKTTGHEPLIFHGSNKQHFTKDILENSTIVITTYGAISITKKQYKNKKVSLLHHIAWSRVIYDEAHHLRNKKTSLTLGNKLLRSNIRWLVSGTPVQNKRNDFYNLCAALKMPRSYYTDENKLTEIARNFILKRTKRQVGIEMSDLIVEKEMVAWQSEKEKQLSEEIHAALKFTNIPLERHGELSEALSDKKQLVTILRAKQSCIYPRLIKKLLEEFIYNGLNPSYAEGLNYSSKISHIIEKIIARKDNGNGKIIFCHYREEMDEIKRQLEEKGVAKISVIDGKTSNTKRNEILSEKKDVLILQIQTGCEGLNLQENYSEIYFVSPHWNPSVEDQAIARCHRIGQTKTVYVSRFEMGQFTADKNEKVKPTNIDNYVSTIQNTKREISNNIFNVCN